MRRPFSDSGRTPAAADRLSALEAENLALQARLTELTEEVSRNDSLLRKTQDRELELLRAGSLAQLLERMIHGLQSSYQLDAVTLLLHDPQHEIRHLLSGDGFLVDELAGVQFADVLTTVAPQLANLERPWLGPFSKADHELLLPGGANTGSLALIPLRRNEQLDGVLVFASTDPLRFTRDLASDFLRHLGVVAAICVENAVNRARLVRSGDTDFLTGFPNRRYLHSRLRQELARAQRAGHALACLMIDVDHFKRINDQYGHLAGDAVLREVAQRIDAEMRLSDMGARFGGDEFAIVLRGADASTAPVIAERIRADCAAADMVTRTGKISVTASFGLALRNPMSTETTMELIGRADCALYRAKDSGRNQVRVAADTDAG